MLCSHGTCMYSGVICALPSRTIVRGGDIFMTGAVLDVEDFSVPNDAGCRCWARVVKSTFSAGGPSIRRASRSFCVSGAEDKKGSFTSLATLMMTSNVVACSTVGSK